MTEVFSTPTEVFSTPTEVFSTPTEVYSTPTEVSSTPTEVFSYHNWGFSALFLSCKANDRVKPAKTGHGPHSAQLGNNIQAVS